MRSVAAALIAVVAVAALTGCRDRLTIYDYIDGGTYGQVNAVAYDSGGASGGFNEFKAYADCVNVFGQVTRRTAAYWTSMVTGAGQVGDVSYQSYVNCAYGEQLLGPPGAYRRLNVG
jgi:hypothetical protein